MNGKVRGDEAEAVGKLKAFLAQRAPLSFARMAERGLVDKLHGYPGFDTLPRTSRPSLEHVPCAETQMLRNKEPDAGKRSGNLVRQELAHTPLDALWITGFIRCYAVCPLCFHKYGVRSELMEFFFECRTPL